MRDQARAERLLRQTVTEGSAAEKMRSIIAAQGGDPRVVDEPDRMSLGRHRRTLKAARDGYVAAIDPLEIGYASMGLGAGRTRAEDLVDPGAGIELHVGVGDRIRMGDAVYLLDMTFCIIFCGGIRLLVRNYREIYLAGFERAVKQGKPWTVMCAYNRLNGTYCCEHETLMTAILTEEWGHEGLVVTDWGAIKDTDSPALHGLDL